MSACEKVKQPLKALELFEVMQGQTLTPDVITYNALISACEKGKQPGKALEPLEAMQGQRLTPNDITYNFLMGIFYNFVVNDP